MSKLENKVSRVLSLVLRHDPGSIGLALNEQGWAEVDELLVCLKRSGKAVDLEMLKKVVTNSSQQRFSFSEDGKLIRANEGHSFNIDLELEEKNPPENLYHGTADRFMEFIERGGLLKMKRDFVHLTSDPKIAHEAGGRQGVPVILEIGTKVMLDHGFRFYQAKNGVWLTDSVPPDYLTRRFRI
ncbi:MAG: RNA 2'-phosphotransferase [Verrucomicrobiaceae bacterium]